MFNPEALQRVQAQPTVSVDDAASVFGISKSTAYMAISNNEWPVVRIRNRIVVPSKWIRDTLGIEAVAA